MNNEELSFYEESFKNLCRKFEDFKSRVMFALLELTLISLVEAVLIILIAVLH